MVLAIEAVEILRSAGVVLPFSLGVAGFSDEEGVRFQSAYIGSKAFCGLLTLERADAAGSEWPDSSGSLRAMEREPNLSCQIRHSPLAASPVFWKYTWNKGRCSKVKG